MHGSKQLILGGLAAISVVLLGVAGPAAAQTDTSQPPATVTQTQTPTTSTTTSSTPTTSTPTTSTPTESGSAAPNEYVESVPTASGSRPVSRRQSTSQPSSSTSSSTRTSKSPQPTDTAAESAALKPKHGHRARRHAPRLAAPTAPAAGPTTQVPVAPASATEGGNGSLIWLLAAMAAITAAIIATAGLQRRRARA